MVRISRTMRERLGKGCGVSYGHGTGQLSRVISRSPIHRADESRQMSTLLSRPLLIDQDDQKLEIPDGRLENITDPEAPHPLSSVALQASLGFYVSHLFQKMGTDNSIQLVLQIEDALEKWMGTFPASMRDHRPDTRWDQKYPNVPFMRCQVNVVAYCYLLAPLKPYLLGNADPEVMTSPLGSELRVKGVDTCLDLMKAGERFYDIAFPQNIKYFFIIFFMFDAATVMCSAIVHDTDHSLPKRSQCIRSLRTAQELMDGVAHLSESARISAQLLRKLVATLPLTQAESQILGVGHPSASSSSSCSSSKKIKTNSSPEPLTSGLAVGGDLEFAHNVAAGQVPTSISSARTDSILSTMGGTPHDVIQQQQQQQQTTGYHQGYMPIAPADTANWAFMDYSAGLPVSTGGGLPESMGLGTSQLMATPMQPGDPLTGTYLETLWDWDRLNMDLSQTRFGL